jgi:hypothetical protein
MRALLVCHRQGSAGLSGGEIDVLDARLRPDNLPRRTPRVSRANGVVSVTFNPPEGSDTGSASVCLGASSPRRDAPDGSIATLRADDRAIELVNDAVGSRTVWYAMTDDLFVASTSQRAIASILGSFEPNRHAFAWMLSSGTLGPGFGWDSRVRPVPAGGRVRLDRAKWRLRIEEPGAAGGDEAERAAARYSKSGRVRARREAHRRGLERAIEQAFSECRFDPERWILPLSGGVDSRGILLFLDDARRFKSVTWGVERSLADPSSDGRIAERLAAHFGLAHRFLPISISEEPRARLVERFLVAGEGRTDRLSGYLDGFEIWRIFAEQGAEGVIRGDEAFGWNPVRSEAEVLRECGVTRLDDVLDERSRAAADLPAQSLPPMLERRAGESLASWRDRLYRQFRLPVLLAALTDLKCAYVEVANPLLSRGIIECVRTLPDRLRTDKRLWRSIVRRRSPPIPFAARTGVYPLRDFVREPATLELMLEELGGDAARDVLGDGLARMVHADADRLRADGERLGPGAMRRHRSGIGGRVRRLVGRGAHVIFRTREKRTLEPEILAFRAFLIARSVRMLGSDAEALDRHAEAPDAGHAAGREGTEADAAGGASRRERAAHKLS